MLRTIIWYIHFAVSLALTIPQIFTAKKLKKSGGFSKFADYVLMVTSTWADGQLKWAGVKVFVHGLDNIPADRTVLFVSNHQSNFDIPLFLCKIPGYKGFIAKIELKKVPAVNTWMEFLGCVFMDRNDLKQSVKCIIEGINILKSGVSMVVFPEGTRSKGNEMGEFKQGTFKLATKPGVPIVPVTVDGTYKIMEENKMKIKPAAVNIYIHPPIETKGLSGEEKASLPETVKEIIRKPLQ